MPARQLTVLRLIVSAIISLKIFEDNDNVASTSVNKLVYSGCSLSIVRCHICINERVVANNALRFDKSLNFIYTEICILVRKCKSFDSLSRDTECTERREISFNFKRILFRENSDTKLIHIRREKKKIY